MMEKVRVLIVDDSSFFRQRIRQELSQADEIEICGEASNGEEAVVQARKLKPDVITMDVAMPVMDGISAVRGIMRDTPARIIMFSALTTEGARATLDALDAGAVDFLAKQEGLHHNGQPHGDCSLTERILHIAREGGRQAIVGRSPAPAQRRVTSSAPHAVGDRLASPPRIVVIGASTGGPVAMQRVLEVLPADYPLPILVAVHMPAEFTAAFAERLDRACRLEVRLAADGDLLTPGSVLVAPGGVQTLVGLRGKRMRVQLAPPGAQLYKPCIDVLFGSVAQALGDAALAVVLTGMGSDGTEGARQLKAGGAAVWSQDRDSSVVYGMPYSVARAGCTDRVLALDDIGEALAGVV